MLNRLRARRYNHPQPGAVVFVRPRHEQVALRFGDGTPTGEYLLRSKLHHELAAIDAYESQRGQRFHRGGHDTAPGDFQPYGDVLDSDLDWTPRVVGSPNGRPAPIAETRTLRVQAIPASMLYKPHEPTALWNYFGDSSRAHVEQHGNVVYTFLCWSALNVHGGGQARCLVLNRVPLEMGAVAALKLPSWDASGRRNGWVQMRYCAAYGLWGWLVAAHQLDNGQGVVEHLL